MTAATRPAAEGPALPVADAATVRRRVRALARHRRGPLAATLFWFALATACDLVVPALIGRLVSAIQRGTTMPSINIAVGVIALFLLAQFVLGRTALVASASFGEATLADLREDFVASVLALPIETVEAAGSGDLLTRSSRDVDTLSRAARSGAPAILTACLTILLTLVALAITSPLLLLGALVAVPPVWLATRWYLRRARPAYLRQAASYSALTGGLSESVSGARTIDAMRLGPRRIALGDAHCGASYAAERATLHLRSVWFSALDLGYILPVVAVSILGAIGYSHGLVPLGAVVAAVLYARALVMPLDLLLFWLDELQSSGAALARIVGVTLAPSDDVAATVDPPAADAGLTASGVSYSYRDGVDAVHDIDLTMTPGERLAVVGPTGAGKSTLGRLLAGIHRPRAGSVRAGRVDLQALPLAERRRLVAMVTQENHLFVGTVRHNVALVDPAASAEQVYAALDAVDVGDWVRALPDGLDTQVGAGGLDVPPARAQQLALARIVLADPSTVILDEATSLLDPGSARHLERSLSGVLAGRTVIAIAHRLHTAREADRIAVMSQGRIVEVGSHAELVASPGLYAELWHSWQGGDNSGRGGDPASVHVDAADGSSG